MKLLDFLFGLMNESQDISERENLRGEREIRNVNAEFYFTCNDFEFPVKHPHDVKKPALFVHWGVCTAGDL